MGLLRVRLTSFLVGFGVAGGLGMYQLRQDVLTSHEVLSRQADEYRSKLEKRVAQLESLVAKEPKQELQN
eukprot:gene18716-25238_t